MSHEFASIMEAISGDTIEEKVKLFSDVLDKVTQFAVNALDQLTKKANELQGMLQNMQGRITQLEQRPAAAPGGYGTAPPPPIPEGGPAAAPAPKPAPKPMAPVSARAALQGELKALFAKRKQH